MPKVVADAAPSNQLLVVDEQGSEPVLVPRPDDKPVRSTRAALPPPKKAAAAKKPASKEE